MISKTTSSNFVKFGTIVQNIPDEDFIVEEFTVSTKVIHDIYSYNQAVYLEAFEGMAMVGIVRVPEVDSIESFALHRRVRIEPDVYFNLTSMSEHIVYRLYIPKHATKTTYTLPKPFVYESISPKIRVSEIIAYYYVVKRPAYSFLGETHNYYELTFVDQGSLDTTVDGKSYTIGINECMLYVPGQFHDQKVSSDNPCSYLTVIFAADGVHTDLVSNRVISCTREMQDDINRFVSTSDQENPFKYDGMISCLEQILISFHMYANAKKMPKPITPVNQHFEDRLVEEILEYIHKHILEPLPIEQICDRFAISRSTLQNLFKNNLQVPPKQYINTAKLNQSRLLIRKGDYTITEIASMLSFNSIHYFSRKFTQSYGITPSEYARKIYDQID